MTTQARRLRLDIGHVRRGKMKPFGVYASIIPPIATAVGVGALAGLEDST